MNHRQLSVAVLCASCLLGVSCHPNRPDAPAIQQMYVGTMRNNVYNADCSCSVALNTYKGHDYIDGECRIWGSSRVLHDGESYEIEGFKKGTSIQFVNIPSALTRGLASAWTGKQPQQAVDSIYKTNKRMGEEATKFSGRLSGSMLSGTWISELSATDRQNNPGTATTQHGTFSLKRQ